MVGFVLYLIIYYSKYFKGNFYINYSIQGLGEVLSLFYVDRLNNRYGSAKSILYFLIVMTVLLSFAQIVVTETSLVPVIVQTSILPLMILMIRL